MSKPVFTFIATLFAGLLGLVVGYNLKMEGYLGIYLSVATAGAFIVHSTSKSK